MELNQLHENHEHQENQHQKKKLLRLLKIQIQREEYYFVLCSRDGHHEKLHEALKQGGLDVDWASPVDGFTATFQKSGPRPALEISTVSMGVAFTLDEGVLNGVRVAIGAVAPIPLRATATEAVLEGQTLNEDIIDKAVEAVQQEVTPIDDLRASAWYRKHLTGVYIRRALSHAAGN